jgi:DNA polymerase III epsilon subunit-like protein
MPNICFIYTDTNGLHKSSYDSVSSKNTYKFARLIAFHYLIGNYNNGKFTETFTKHIILKPKTINFDEVAMSFHKITMEEANTKGIDNTKALNELKEDLKNVNILVSFSLPFHIKALQVECIRTAIEINFNKYTLIDMMSFGHNSDYPKFADMLIKYNINKKLTQLEQYRDLFLILYNNYIKTITKTEPNNECDFVD